MADGADDEFSGRAPSVATLRRRRASATQSSVFSADSVESIDNTAHEDAAAQSALLAGAALLSTQKRAAASRAGETGRRALRSALFSPSAHLFSSGSVILLRAARWGPEHAGAVAALRTCWAVLVACLLALCASLARTNLFFHWPVVIAYVNALNAVLNTAAWAAEWCFVPQNCAAISSKLRCASAFIPLHAALSLTWTASTLSPRLLAVPEALRGGVFFFSALYVCADSLIVSEVVLLVRQQ